MSSRQRYVSAELTHFIGRGRTEAEQYSILIKILKEGNLVPKEYNPDYLRQLKIDYNREFSTGEMYNPNVICFCDIPLADLSIHMDKYSYFGISFLKSHLVAKGANPVFYQAEDSAIIPAVSHESRCKYFNKMVKQYVLLMAKASGINVHGVRTSLIL